MISNIFDTHAHYADHAFDDDRGQILAELPQKGVKYVMLASSSLEDTAENAVLAEKFTPKMLIRLLPVILKKSVGLPKIPRK